MGGMNIKRFGGTKRRSIFLAPLPPPRTMDPVHVDILKGTEIGLVFSGAMWGVTTMQTFSYFQRFKSDSLYLKIAVRDIRQIPLR
jgi:hypothetical protein